MTYLNYEEDRVWWSYCPRCGTKLLRVKGVKNFKDYYGFDIPEAPELKTKLECKTALLSHKLWLELALTDALTGVDAFIREKKDGYNKMRELHKR